MAQDTRATIIGGGGLLEAAAVALAGLTALAALAEHRTDRTSCSAPIPANFEQRTAPVERPPGVDAMLRDMRLHD